MQKIERTNERTSELTHRPKRTKIEHTKQVVTKTHSVSQKCFQQKKWNGSLLLWENGLSTSWEGQIKRQVLGGWGDSNWLDSNWHRKSTKILTGILFNIYHLVSQKVKQSEQYSVNQTNKPKKIQPKKIKERGFGLDTKWLLVRQGVPNRVHTADLPVLAPFYSNTLHTNHHYFTWRLFSLDSKITRNRIIVAKVKKFLLQQTG